jgi:polyribonucleotide nucleotidyltransferase
MLELLQKYPEAGKVVKDHFLSKMLDSLNDDNIPDDFKEHVRNMGIEDEKIARMVGNAPRSMFDVFDENDLFINVTFDHTDRMFRWSVDGQMDSQTYIFRKAAEQEAVAEAFKLLNERLCQTGL